MDLAVSSCDPQRRTVRLALPLIRAWFTDLPGVTPDDVRRVFFLDTSSETTTAPQNPIPTPAAVASSAFCEHGASSGVPLPVWIDYLVSPMHAMIGIKLLKLAASDFAYEIELDADTYRLTSLVARFVENDYWRPIHDAMGLRLDMFHALLCILGQRIGWSRTATLCLMPRFNEVKQSAGGLLNIPQLINFFRPHESLQKYDHAERVDILRQELSRRNVVIEAFTEDAMDRLPEMGGDGGGDVSTSVSMVPSDEALTDGIQRRTPPPAAATRCRLIVRIATGSDAPREEQLFTCDSREQAEEQYEHVVIQQATQLWKVLRQVSATSVTASATSAAGSGKNGAPSRHLEELSDTEYHAYHRWILNIVKRMTRFQHPFRTTLMELGVLDDVLEDEGWIPLSLAERLVEERYQADRSDGTPCPTAAVIEGLLQQHDFLQRFQVAVRIPNKRPNHTAAAAKLDGGRENAPPSSRNETFIRSTYAHDAQVGLASVPAQGDEAMKGGVVHVGLESLTDVVLNSYERVTWPQVAREWRPLIENWRKQSRTAHLTSSSAPLPVELLSESSSIPRYVYVHHETSKKWEQELDQKGFRLYDRNAFVVAIVRESVDVAAEYLCRPNRSRFDEKLSGDLVFLEFDMHRALLDAAGLSVYRMPAVESHPPHFAISPTDSKYVKVTKIKNFDEVSTKRVKFVPMAYFTGAYLRVSADGKISRHVLVRANGQDPNMQSLKLVLLPPLIAIDSYYDDRHGMTVSMVADPASAAHEATPAAVPSASSANSTTVPISPQLDSTTVPVGASSATPDTVQKNDENKTGPAVTEVGLGPPSLGNGAASLAPPDGSVTLDVAPIMAQVTEFASSADALRMELRIPKLTEKGQAFFNRTVHMKRIKAHIIELGLRYSEKTITGTGRGGGMAMAANSGTACGGNAAACHHPHALLPHCPPPPTTDDAAPVGEFPIACPGSSSSPQPLVAALLSSTAMASMFDVLIVSKGYQFSATLIQDLESELGINFTNRQLLRAATTAQSVDSHRDRNYERLEFIGDAVLDFVIAHDTVCVFGGGHHRHQELSGAKERLDASASVPAAPYQQRWTSTIHTNVVSVVCPNSVLCWLLPKALEEEMRILYGAELVEKTRADMVESILGAVYKDGHGLDRIRKLCQYLFTGMRSVLAIAATDRRHPKMKDSHIASLNEAVKACPYLAVDHVDDLLQLLPPFDMRSVFPVKEMADLRDSYGSKRKGGFEGYSTSSMPGAYDSHRALFGHPRIQDKAYATHFTTGSIYSYRRVASHTHAAMVHNRILQLFCLHNAVPSAYVNEAITEFTPLTLDVDGVSVSFVGLERIITRWFARTFPGVSMSSGLVLDCSGTSVVTKKYKRSCHVHFPQVLVSLRQLGEHTDALRQFIKQHVDKEQRLPAFRRGQMVLLHGVSLGYGGQRHDTPRPPPGAVASSSLLAGHGDGGGSSTNCSAGRVLLVTRQIAMELVMDVAKIAATECGGSGRSPPPPPPVHPSASAAASPSPPLLLATYRAIQDANRPLVIAMRYLHVVDLIYAMPYVSRSYRILAFGTILATFHKPEALRTLLRYPPSATVPLLPASSGNFVVVRPLEVVGMGVIHGEVVPLAFVPFKETASFHVFDSGMLSSTVEILQNTDRQLEPLCASFNQLSLLLRGAAARPITEGGNPSTSAMAGGATVKPSGLYFKVMQPLLEKDVYSTAHWAKVIDKGLTESRKLRMYLCDKWDTVYDQEYRPLLQSKLLVARRLDATILPGAGGIDVSTVTLRPQNQPLVGRKATTTDKQHVVDKRSAAIHPSDGSLHYHHSETSGGMDSTAVGPPPESAAFASDENILPHRCALTVTGRAPAATRS